MRAQAHTQSHRKPLAVAHAGADARADAEPDTGAVARADATAVRRGREADEASRAARRLHTAAVPALRGGHVLQGWHGRDVHAVRRERDRAHDVDGGVRTVWRGAEDGRHGPHQVRSRGGADARADAEPDTCANCNPHRGANPSTDRRALAEPDAEPNSSPVRRRLARLR